MINIHKCLGKKIKYYRKSKNLSTTQLAKHLNVSVGLINNIENSRHDVFKLELLYSLATKLDTTIEDLLSLDLLDSNNFKLESTINKQALSNISKDESKLNMIRQCINDLMQAYLSTITSYDCNERSIQLMNSFLIDSLQLFKTLPTTKDDYMVATSTTSKDA